MQILDGRLPQGAAVMNGFSRSRYVLPAFFIFMGAMIVYMAGDGGAQAGAASVLGGGLILFGVLLAASAGGLKRKVNRDV